jgi:hypothetical protein
MPTEVLTAQQEKDANDRAAFVKQANDAEGTITIQTSRAFHFQHPGKPNEGIVVKPNTATIVPAWVKYTDTWVLATRDELPEGYPAQIVILKDAKPGTVETVLSGRVTDAPKSPEQVVEDLRAAREVHLQMGGKTSASVDESQVGTERTAEQKAADAADQAERLKQQKTAPDATKGALDDAARAQKAADAQQTKQAQQK